MSSKGAKTNNVGWEVDLSTIFEDTTAGELDENDPIRQPTFTLEIGETCQPKPEHLQTLYEGQGFKILIRREADNLYWYLDTEGKQGHFVSSIMEFWCSQWEKI